MATGRYVIAPKLTCSLLMLDNLEASHSTCRNCVCTSGSV